MSSDGQSANTAANKNNNISSLPPHPLASSRAAVDAAMASVASKVQQQQKDAGSDAAASSSTQQQTAGMSSAPSDSSITDNSVDQSNASFASTGTDADLDVITTVFQDQNHFNVKHPLWNTWTLWFDNPSTKGGGGGGGHGGGKGAPGGKDAWGEDQVKVVTIESVEEFWGLYNNIIPPSDLPARANYYLFKDGIRPAWEDPANANGGKWSIQLPRDKSRESINTLWLHTMLQAIGETLEASYPENVPNQAGSFEDELVTGVIMSARPNFYRIVIWTRRADDDLEAHASNPNADAPETKLATRLIDIGKQFKVNVLGYKLEGKAGAGSSGFATEVEFQSHRESEKKKGKKMML
ncbi:unnamed protein product [Tilletia laevis]|uniref:Eukaryotic translation initiation factor 4E n=3 Tax=Tilletia TaxID=13289 RepID=A0A8X7N132_9BASI|nr:hypothetical protein CF336_g1606 [Tilletia laevis]KAE8206206.1 hypothetical protein CF328_g50 [Tilletia controversa]KAE8263945.1 hypothetical protein A4X03_0g1312 [Tilletia caries]KAE8207757.1 hypothetical protein CF335_g917 [Tilletia laevis]KAE8256196.1 hypothetical protein A4X06_0g20 [Tilletia controversa]